MIQADLLRALVALTLLASCVPTTNDATTEWRNSAPTTDQWRRVFPRIKGDPAVRMMFENECNTDELSPDQVAAMALLLRVPESEALETFCERLIWAIMKDEVTPEQMVEARRDNKYAPILRAVTRP